MKWFQGNLQEVVTGDLRIIEFHGQDIRCQDTNISLHPKDNFRVPKCKRVLDPRSMSPQPVTFFRKEFKDLQEIVAESVNKYYLGQYKLGHDSAVEVVTKLFGTVKLSSLIDVVHDSDGNLDSRGPEAED